jgi:hypothetical protein
VDHVACSAIISLIAFLMTDLLIVPDLAGGFIVLIRGEGDFCDFDPPPLSAFEAAVIVNASYNFYFLSPVKYFS